MGLHKSQAIDDPRFVQYYEAESQSLRSRQRALGIQDAVLRIRRAEALSVDDLVIADIGCNAGTQSACWLANGHRVCGVDINRDLVGIARERASEYGSRAEFAIGSAVALPWDDGKFDVVLLPELLEHVADWEECLSEAVRVLKPGGHLYLSTTNVLCPIQQEFTLWGFSWYPRWLKRYFIRRSVTSSPHLANFATYPAVNWFSPYGLIEYLRKLGVTSMDRFDLIDVSRKGRLSAMVVSAIRKYRVLRFFAHVLTPSTVILGIRTSNV